MNIVLSTHSVWVEEMLDIPGIILRFFFPFVQQIFQKEIKFLM